ncbi:MAG: CPBP family glutamic-type intramembrane protease [Candidatus Binatus sp.]|uniref:CPBP family glutamic-type intramembrane protease n=1 Tax=Candidatus Binatus sp. TaxID=2811406 RepID=UPI0027284D9B|nr:CPBP family glutamic-type intramembrane protease [Candidatus Binatus sp.]MDO8432896.1 CPBP family glutamic-type intramembrane protease [Candidatus Binatus sp.]
MANRSNLFREALLLMALSLIGALLEYPLALMLKSIDRSEVARTIPFLIVASALTGLIPAVLKSNAGLGLPGAPIISARIAGARSAESLRSLGWIALRYAFFAAILGALALFIVIVPMMVLHPAGEQISLPKSPILGTAPGRLAGVGAMVAIAAAFSEEIQFRLVLTAVFAWIISRLSRAERPGKAALWIATILQAYAFGMIHLVPVAGPLLHNKLGLLIGGLMMPQTWEGVVFGRLYIKRGLEAAILAHGLMDAGLFALAALGMWQSHLGAG